MKFQRNGEQTRNTQENVAKITPVGDKGPRGVSSSEQKPHPRATKDPGVSQAANKNPQVEEKEGGGGGRADGKTAVTTACAPGGTERLDEGMPLAHHLRQALPAAQRAGRKGPGKESRHQTPGSCCRPNLRIQEILDSLTSTTRIQEILDSLLSTTRIQQILDSLTSTTRIQQILDSLPSTTRIQQIIDSLPSMTGRMSTCATPLASLNWSADAPPK